ncbi:uncharacterized protein LOC119678471 [Teleopsis dalmanni]|uniref:uncharacterized protein LOC119678471 n=1 Tax=Teleopsis dalmanni TaxID=139649 RepID=UPI0018CF3CFC|nr:uncharacterized protein LOC119678471 [Teleopsis dalmanni]XP_037946241.1 uncharacterized protein LOC119678471 [Teleopsis dalmanni]
MVATFVLKKIFNFKYIFLIILSVSYVIKQDSTYFQKTFKKDLEYCEICFQTQTEQCSAFLNTTLPTDSLILRSFYILTNWIRPDKVIRHLRLKSTEIEIVGKYFSNRKRLNQIKSDLISTDALRHYLINDESIGRFHLCPQFGLNRFINYFLQIPNQYVEDNTSNRERTILIYMLIHVQPLILPLLHAKGFPVPNIYATCGFSIFQSNAGQSMTAYRKSPFDLKLKIAKQILEAAIMFSYGFANFRIYITDMSEDNIFYDATVNKIYFVDLDTIFVIDSESIGHDGVHRHDLIECHNCFAYSPDDLCSHKLSDMNLFAACQLLRDNTHNSFGGFLKPYPENHSTLFPKLAALLDICVECPVQKCHNRFAVTLQIIDILEEYSKNI